VHPYPPDWLCSPCRLALHDVCMGGAVFCCCLTEVLIEAEERRNDEPT
jgi:hypothetical protein